MMQSTFIFIPYKTYQNFLPRYFKLLASLTPVLFVSLLCDVIPDYFHNDHFSSQSRIFMSSMLYGTASKNAFDCCA